MVAAVAVHLDGAAHEAAGEEEAEVVEVAAAVVDVAGVSEGLDGHMAIYCELASGVGNRARTSSMHRVGGLHSISPTRIDV